MPETPPAGWYSDPDGANKQRFWNGTEWTVSSRRTPNVHTKLARASLVAAGVTFMLLIGAVAQGVDPNSSTEDYSAWVIGLLVVLAGLIGLAGVELVVARRQMR